MGAYEVVKDAFRELGTVEFAKVAMQPGGPQGAGTVDGVPVLTLPGNPVSAYVSFEVFVRPALRRALGHTASRPAARAGAADRSRCAPPPAAASTCAAATTGAPSSQVGGPGSHLVAHLARADCLVVVAEDVTSSPPGPRSTSS